jgi:hypothetical protein
VAGARELDQLGSRDSCGQMPRDRHEVRYVLVTDADERRNLDVAEALGSRAAFVVEL